jgi:metacaspase-1
MNTMKKLEGLKIKSNTPRSVLFVAAAMAFLFLPIKSFAGNHATNVLCIAATSETEVAMATSKSAASTLLWQACLGGSADLRVSLITAIPEQSFATSGVVKVVSSSPLAAAGDQTLQNIRAAASNSIKVDLKMSTTELQIGQSNLDFSVTTSKGGYLYVLHVGTKGDDFIQLFPNRLDPNNFVAAGSHAFPRANWRVRSGGPAGTGYVMAYLSDTQKDFAKALSKPAGC